MPWSNLHYSSVSLPHKPAQFVKFRSRTVSLTSNNKVPSVSRTRFSLSFQLATVNHLLLTVYSLLSEIYSTCCKCCSVASTISCPELLDIFLKAFSCCLYEVHDAQAFNVLTNQFLTLKTPHSLKWVNQSFHILLQRGVEARILSAFLCTLYTTVCSDWRANSKTFNHSNQPSCSVIFFANSP